MDILNLLSLTAKRQLNNESEATENREVYLGCPDCAAYLNEVEEYETVEQINVVENDTIEINGRVIDIMGNLTDEQIEAVLKVGYDNAFEKMMEILTTCTDITDEELLEIFLNETNPSKDGIPPRLHLVRDSFQPSTDSDEPEGESPDITDLDEGEIPDDSEFNTENPEWTVIRRNSSSRTVNNKITLKTTSSDYKDAFPDCYYTIEPYEKSSCSVKVKYLANGRILITGDNIKVVAKGGQEDNIILMGNNNYIDTNSGNDVVRVGVVRDSQSKYLEIKTKNNIIKTGDGDDYVESVGYNSVNMGGGNGDKILTFLGQNSAGTEWTKTAFKGEEEYIKLTSYTIGNSYPDEGYRSENSNSASDGQYGWSFQNGFGDCQFLSTLNSLCKNHSLSEYVTITPDGNNWIVDFKNSSPHTTQTVKSSDIVGGSALGDKDIQILEAAIRLIMKNNHRITLEDKSGNNTLGYSENWKFIGKYLFGIEKGGINQTALTEEKYQWLVNNYTNGNLSQVSFGCDSTVSAELGIIGGHAYSLTGGVAGQYVDIINPHDSNDSIRLDWNDFKKYFKIAVLIGDTYEKYKAAFETFNSAVTSSTGENSDTKEVFLFQNNSEISENTGRKRLSLYS